MAEKRFDDDDYSIVSETHFLRKGMPTVEEVLRAQGRRLTNEELNYMLSINAIPSIITQDMTPVLHKITRGDEEFYVLMVDEPPCDCRRTAGKKEKCEKHKYQKKKLKNEIGSTNKTTSHDANDITIAFSKTPEYVCSKLPSGTPVLVPIDRSGNEKIARVAESSDFALHKLIKGILVKGPSDCPQFIPDEKVPKKDGLPCFTKYVTGYLTQTDDGKSVFYPENIESNNGIYLKYDILTNVMESAADAQKLYIITDSGMPAIGLKTPEKKSLAIPDSPASNAKTSVLKAQQPMHQEIKEKKEMKTTSVMSQKSTYAHPAFDQREHHHANVQPFYPNNMIQSTYQQSYQPSFQPVNPRNNTATPEAYNSNNRRENVDSAYFAAPGQSTPRPQRSKKENKTPEKKNTNINSMYMK